MTRSANGRDLRRTMLTGLADGRPHTRVELMDACHVGHRRFDRQRRELVHLGLLARVDERVVLTPIGQLHAKRVKLRDE